MPVLLLVMLLGSITGTAQDVLLAQDLKRLSVEELMDIDITSVSRRTESLGRTAAAVQVITGEDIRRSGVTSIPEALRLFAGVQVSRFNTGSWAISVRGFTTNVSNKLLVLVDGRSVYNPLFSGTFWEVQDTVLADIDRIEVVRGPGATLWGSNAVNGVINIITKSASRTEGGLVRLAGGGRQDLGLVSVRWGGRLGSNTTYRVFSKYSYRDQLQFANGGDTKDPLRVGRAGFRMDSELSPEETVTLQGETYKGQFGLLGRDDAQLSGGNLVARWTRRFSDQSDVQFQIYFDRTNRFVPLQSGERRATGDVELQHRFQRQRQDIIWGAGYQISADRTDSIDTLSTKFSPPGRHLHLTSAFIQDEIRLVPERASLIIGSKFEHNSFTGWEIQPSVRFGWAFGPERTAWAAVSRAIRTPSRFETDIRFAPPGLAFIGNPDFESEGLTAYEAGYRRTVGSKMSFDLATFYNVYDGLRSQEFRPPNIFTSQNELNAHTYGGEITANYDLLERWRLNGGYSHLWKILSMDPGQVDAFNGALEGNDAADMFMVRSSLDLPRDFEFDTTARFVGSLPSPLVPRYLALDARIGWIPTPGVELSVVGHNLTDEAHPESGAAGPFRNEVRRNVYATVNLRF